MTNGRDSMRVLVTGAAGQLGHDVCERLTSLGVENRGVDAEDFDLRDREAVRRAVLEYAPTHVVHCGAYTAVDRAEAEQDLCMAVNAAGTENIAKACREAGADLMYFSTDYVFDGKSSEMPWETDAPAAPINVYGRSKYEGEQAVRENVQNHYILRISWVFGANGANFVKTMLRLSDEKPEITVVCDQYGAPTYTKDLAVLVSDMLGSGRYGTYHTPNEGMTSWYDFANEIMQAAGRRTRIVPVASKDYPAAAARPKNSRLSTRALRDAGFQPLPHYHDALVRYLGEIGAVQ